MKKLTSIVFCIFALSFMLACNEESTETTQTQEATTTEQVELTTTENLEENESPSSFFEVMDFQPSGYTPGYRYFLAGSLDSDGSITQIHFDMVSTSDISKRSENYRMNVSYIMIGGSEDYQTIDIYLGGSTENIAQAMYTIKGQIKADGSDLLMSLPLLSFFGAPVDHKTVPVAEIYQLLSSGIEGFDIDDQTTLADFLKEINLYDTDNALVKNGRQVLGLKGKWGGGTFHEQLLALESYIVEEGLTLVELYDFFTQNNQVDDLERDAVAGVTMMFESKMVKIVAAAAGIDLWDGETVVTDAKMVSGNHVLTVRTMGYNEMTVQVELTPEKSLVSISVLEHTETSGFGLEVIEGDFISQIISSNDLSQIDTVSGVTQTSNALIESVEVALSYLDN